jgi:uncharacterized protein YutE (UPF0331/DUF86 family)
LAIETVTDVGSLLIDGFLLRDAAGYGDIVSILTDEQAIGEDTAAFLLQLVKLRRPLVQDYYLMERSGRQSGRHPLLAQLPSHMEAFAASVRAFVLRELERSG